MIYLCNSEGLIVASVPSAVNQGSVGVNEIVLIAPFHSTSAVSLAFTLPNGVLVYPQAFPPASSDYPYNMTLADSFSGQLPGGYNVWTMKLNKALTQVAGTARISFFITGADGETVSTPSTTFNINKSTGYILNVSENELNTIASYVAAASMAASNAEESYQKFKDENRYDIIYTLEEEYEPIWFQEKIIQDVDAFSSNSGRPPSILIKNSVLVGVDQDQLRDLGVTLPREAYLLNPGRDREIFADGFIYIPENVSLVTFSGCSFDVSSFETGVSIFTAVENNCKIEVLSAPDVDAINGVSIACFDEVADCNANLIANCNKVHNCTASRIASCKNVSDCSNLNDETIVIIDCTYVDLYSIPNVEFWSDYSDSVATDLSGKLVDLTTGRTADNLLPIASGIGGDFYDDKLSLYLNFVNGDNSETLDIELPLSRIYRYKGSVRTFADLPAGAEIGDVYNVEEAYDNYAPGTNFAWNGEVWDALGGSIDLSAYLTAASAAQIYLTKTEFNATIGNISSALDEIISIQESLIGGNNV